MAVTVNAPPFSVLGYVNGSRTDWTSGVIVLVVVIISYGRISTASSIGEAII